LLVINSPCFLLPETNFFWSSLTHFILRPKPSHLVPHSSSKSSFSKWTVNVLGWWSTLFDRKIALC
jgi:hypothetical protein